MTHDYKNEHPADARPRRRRDPIEQAELRGMFVGLIYGAVIGLLILAPLWAQLLDQ